MGYSGNPPTTYGSHPENLTTDYIPGGPFDCSFCHGATGDIATEFADGDKRTYLESTHPVDVINDQEDQTTNPLMSGYTVAEIACADCHMREPSTDYYDIVPKTLQSKDTRDGYPNHKNVIPGYAPYKDLNLDPPTDYPNDAINKAHLTRPYGYSKSQNNNTINATHSDDRYVDWGGPPNATYAGLNRDTLLCFICHSNDTHTDSAGYTHSTEVAQNSYDIEKEYNDPAHEGTYSGHVMRINGAAGSDITAGDKMPCFNCHESHSAMDSGFNNVKLIRVKPNPYGTATFQMNGNVLDGVALDGSDSNGRLDNGLAICVVCHDTDAVDSEPLLSGPGVVVRGIRAVDPFYSSTSASLHAGAGVKDPLADSTTGCIGTTDDSGCHRNIHKPVPAPQPDAPCYACHGAGAGSIVQVNDSNDDNWGNVDPNFYSGRGGDFGDKVANTKIQNLDTKIKSTHNITFDATNHGGDPDPINFPDKRGSCTVCHIIGERANGIDYHTDGDPRNDFRDVDPNNTDPANELDPVANGVVAAPVLIDTATGYRYEPEWMLCVDCHDDEAIDASEPFYDLIGTAAQWPPMNLDGFMVFDNANPPNVVQEIFAYGSGDHTNVGHDVQTPVDNSTPVHNYNHQPYKAHYYQTDGTQESPSKVWQTADPAVGLTDPLDPSYDPVAKERIINCLDCHFGHGSRNASLYRSPDPNFKPNTPLGGFTNADGREICLDCHKPGLGGEEVYFPRAYTVTKALDKVPDTTPIRRMWAPPINDRYGNPIVGTNIDGDLGNPHDPSDSIGQTISCIGDNTQPVGGNPNAVYFKCHNVHSPSCETCHKYPISKEGLDFP
jgi:hypothetical protein